MPRLILPYVSPIQKALVAKLRALGSSGNNTLGIVVGGGALAPAIGGLTANGMGGANGLSQLAKVRRLGHARLAVGVQGREGSRDRR